MNELTMPSRLKNLTSSPFLFWALSVSFVLFQFFIQLSSGVVIHAIMLELKLSALSAGLLSSIYYYAYTTLQIPVGMLFDRANSRYLIVSNLFICSLGCLLFSQAEHLPSLMLSRLMIGTGSAFAFVGLSHVLRQHFELSQFGFMIGLSETLSFLVTVLFMLMVGTLIHDIRWRALMLDASFIGAILTVLCAVFLPQKDRPKTPKASVFGDLINLCRNPVAWVNGLFIGLGFTLVTVFGAMWAIPFLTLKAQTSVQIASVIDAMLFLGVGLSCPLFGFLEQRFSNRNWLLCFSYLLTTLLFLSILFTPTKQPMFLGILCFFTGLSSGAYMLGYTVANEIGSDALSTSTGFANTLAMITAPLFQPLVGYVLDYHHDGLFQVKDYQVALLIIPACLLLGAGLSLWLPKKR